MTPPPPTAAEIRALLAESGWVRALARSLVRDPHRAEDLAQDACLAALRSRPEGHRPLRGWMRTVMRNLLRQGHRRNEREAERHRAAARKAETPSTLDRIERLARHRELVEAVESLQEPYRTVVLMRFFEERSPSEIARELGVPVSTVKTRLGRAIERLRGRLDDRHGPGTWLSGMAAFADLTARTVPVLPPIRPTQTAAAPSGAVALSAGAIVVSTQVKLAIVAAIAVTGLIAVWPEDEDGAVLPELEGGGSVAAAESGPALDVRPGPARSRAALGESPAEPGAVVATDPASEPIGRERAAKERVPRFGRVMDQDARSKGAVPVTFEPLGEDREPAASTAGFVADADGRFELTEVTEAGRLVVGDDQLATVYAGHFRPSGAAREPIVVVAPRIGLAGQVVDEAGRPVEGALVEVALPEGFRARFADALDDSELLAFECTSGVDGTFDLARAPLVPGATLSARLEGYADAAVPAPEHDDGAIVLTLERPTGILGSLTGMVVDQDGAPVADARVSFGLHVTRSDQNGAFRFSLDLEGTANAFAAEALGMQPRRLIAFKEGFLPGRLDVEPEGDEDPLWPDSIVLQLGGSPLSIAGRFVDAQETPVAGLRVWADDTTLFGFGDNGPEMLESLLAGSQDRWHYTETSATGAFRIDGLLDRQYTILALDMDTLAFSAAHTVQAGDESAVLTFEPGDVHARVAGRVVSRTGEGVAGVSVRPMCDPFRQRYMGQTVGTTHATLDGTITDADGRFELEDLPAARVFLRVDGDAIVPMEPGRGVEGGIAELGDLESLELIAALRIQARVVLDDPNEADEARVLDAEGQTVPINIFVARGRRTTDSAEIVDGLSEVWTLTDAAETLVLLSGGVEVRRVALDLRPGEINELTP